MSKLEIVKEFYDFLRIRKKWWLVPILFILLLMAVMIVFTESSAIAPLIYTLF